MTKAELVEKAAKDAKISKVKAARDLNSFMNSVTKALKKKNGKVTLVGFGTFIRIRGARRRPFYSNHSLPSKFITFNAAIKQMMKRDGRRLYCKRGLVVT